MTIGRGPSDELLSTFVAHAAERLERIEAAVGRLARGSEPIARQRLLGQLREDAHALRGAASACGLTDAAESAGRLESLAAGLHEDDLELGAAGTQELNEVFATLAAGVPRAAPAASAEAAAWSEPAARTILCVDDDATSRALVRLLLKARPGVRMLEAADGRSGLECARSERPDLVVLDLRLPDLPGRDVLVALGTSPETCDIPILLVSGDDPPGVPVAYLQKPIDPAVFLHVVDDLLAQQPVPYFDTSHLEIDVDDRAVERT